MDADNSRTTYTGSWFDGIGRPVAAADYGDNDGDTMTPGSQAATVYAWNNIYGILVARTEYNAQGQAEWSFDPLNRKTQTEYDAAGRVTKTVQNYVDGDPETGTSDQDVTMLTTYTADGQIDTFTAVNPSTGNQVTRYAYGTTLAESGVAHTDLLRGVIYPDSTNTFTMEDGAPVFSGVYDRVEYEYNRLGQQTQVKDQNQTVHEYLFDKLGRLTEDCATELGTGVDGAVRRIEHTYEVRGMVAHTTSYDNPNVGQGNVVNDVFDEYDEWGLLAKEYQAHDGPVNTLTTPYVGYDYADAAHGLRLESVRYPNGRVLDYVYNTGIDDIVNRVSALADSDETHLADYTYLGLGNILGVTYPEPGVTSDPTLNGYEALDRFGRTAEVLWKKTASPFAPVVDLKYGYNAAGNRTYRQDVVAGANYLDELFEYDDVDQLIDVKRGQLDLSDPENIHIDNQDVAHSQNWNLDALGNWDTVTTGTTPQDRAHNAANELTTADGWVTSTYDLNGNMLTMPQPDNPASAYNLKWDAWNRLVKVTTGSGETEETVAEYVYDGQNRRIVKKVYTEGELSETRHFYQSAENQVVEERLDSGEVADQQYVWGLRYIDDLVLRDRDSDHDGVATEGSYGKTNSGLDERYYAIQDGNWNVVAVVDVSGDVAERYAYSAYGKVEILEEDFDPKTSDLIDWTVLYTGRDLDLETGLQYSRARYYGADLGRFIGRDPIGYWGGNNLYAYVGNDPILLTDPFGMFPPRDTEADCPKEGAAQTWTVSKDITEKFSYVITGSRCLLLLPEYDCRGKRHVYGTRDITVHVVMEIPKGSTVTEKCMKCSSGKLHWFIIKIDDSKGVQVPEKKTMTYGPCEYKETQNA